MANSSHTGLQAVEDPSLLPSCPHCGQTLDRVLTRRMDVSGSAEARFGKRYVYACPECTRVLGFSHRKGFWMG